MELEQCVCGAQFQPIKPRHLDKTIVLENLPYRKANITVHVSGYGSDVYQFPYQNPRNLAILKKNLAAADNLASTSVAMKNKTLEFTPKQANIHLQSALLFAEICPNMYRR